MLRFVKEYRLYFLLLLLYGLSLLVVKPWGDYPLNDDWAYAKSVKIFMETGKIDIGDWPAMTLATHILWGSLFVKIFGFSFLVLRLSTWISMCIGMFFLFKLVFKLSENKVIAFLACLALLFNPIYYNVSNSFMTDVDFLTLLIVGSYVAYLFITTQRWVYLIALLPLSLALTLLRQYGVILPAAVVVTVLFLKNRWKYFPFALLLLVIVYGALLYYENYLHKVLSADAAYQFSGNVNPTKPKFWSNLISGISTRYKIVLIHMFFHTFILSFPFVPALVKSAGYKKALMVLVVMTGLVLWQFAGYPLQVGNVFSDSAVGVDGTYETLIGTYTGHPHFYEPGYAVFLDSLKIIFLSISGSTFILAVLQFFKAGLKFDPARFFFVLLFAAYLVMVLITDTFFDRYQIPVILLSLVLFSSLYRQFKPSPSLVLLPASIILYITVLGSRDYMTLNELKWKTYYELRDKEGIARNKILGSFEIVCWNDGEYCKYFNYVVLKPYDYIVQFKDEPNFEVYREMPFQRCLPFKMDTLRVFKRTKSEPPGLSAQ